MSVQNQLRVDASWPDDHGSAEVTELSRWDSDTPWIASVDAKGVVTALTRGDAVVRPTFRKAHSSGVS